MIPIHTPAQAAKVVEQLAAVPAAAEPVAERSVDWAWTADAYAEAERHAGVRSAVAALVAGNRRLAHDIMLTSFTRQMRIHGLGYKAIPGRPYEQMGSLRGGRR